MKSLPGSWAYEVQTRLRALRVYLGRTLLDAAGDPSLRARVVRLEGHSSANLYLDQVEDIARNLGVELPALLLPWCGASPSQDRVEPAEGTMRDRLLLNLGLAIKASPMSRREITRGAGMHHSTLIRWLSGEYERIDLIRLEAVAGVIAVDPARLILDPPPTELSEEDHETSPEDP